jgi:hypothetical protein
MSNTVEVLKPGTAVFVRTGIKEMEPVITVLSTRIERVHINSDGQVLYTVFGYNYGLTPNRMFHSAEEAFAAQL